MMREKETVEIGCNPCLVRSRDDSVYWPPLPVTRSAG